MTKVYIPGEGLSIDRNIFDLLPDQLSQSTDELRRGVLVMSHCGLVDQIANR
jgi:hypothetical protein